MIKLEPFSLPAIRSQPIRLALVGLLALVLSAGGGMAGAAEYEPEVVEFQAAEIVDTTLLRGPHHTVREEVVNKGFLNQYRIETPFGDFEVSGDRQVVKVVHEIKAIAELKEMSKVGVVAKSAADAAKKPVEVVKNLAERPEETIKGIPAGVGRLFGRAKDVVRDVSEKSAGSSQEGGDNGGDDDAVSEAATNLAMHYVGVGSAHRKLASELEVDPYSTNAMLQSELDGMAKYAAAGSFATKLVMPSLPGMGMLSDVNKLVWGLSARDLKLRNQKSLSAMGADEQLVERFFANPNYTPTDQTRVVAGLERLQGATGRTIVVEKAAGAATRDEALFYARLTEMLGAYNGARTPIERIVQNDRRLPLAVTSTGVALVAAPMDYVNWQRPVEEAAMLFLQAAASQTAEGRGELWVEGRVSDQARRKLTDLGWAVFDRAFERLSSGQ